MRNAVEHLYYNDHALRYLFSKERKDVTLWCSTIIRMGVWATSFDSLIFSYIFKLNVIGVRNYSNGLWGNCNQTFMHQLRLPDIIPESPAIYVLNHQFGSPLGIVNNCNHFGYLKPTSLPTTDSLSQRLPIISLMSESTSSQPSPDLTPTPPTASMLSTSSIHLEATTQPSSQPSPDLTPTSTTASILSTSSIHLEATTQPTTISTQYQMHTSTPPTLSTQSTLQTDHIIQGVPDLCNTINRTEVLDECLSQLSRTNTSGCNHKACVCVVCDCFMIGVEKICWLSQKQLIAKESYLSVSHHEATANKRIPIALRNQYKIENDDTLSSLLLSPRAGVKDGKYMACSTCFIHVSNKKIQQTHQNLPLATDG